MSVEVPFFKSEVFNGVPLDELLARLDCVDAHPHYLEDVAHDDQHHVHLLFLVSEDFIGEEHPDQNDKEGCENAHVQFEGPVFPRFLRGEKLKSRCLYLSVYEVFDDYVHEHSHSDENLQQEDNSLLRPREVVKT